MAFAVVPEPHTQPKFPLQPGLEKRRRIAFVCVGNSCRSQMAEAWVRHLSRKDNLPVEAVSAGLTPLGHITEETLQVMGEKKVSLAGQGSKGLEAIDWSLVELLVNMTPLPGRSVVPGFAGQRLEWKVKDPYGQSLRTYRRVRDQLERKVKRLLTEMKKSPPGGPASAPLA